MSEFNEYNWKMTLLDLFQKSVQDPVFRQLCLTNPLEAIAQISDIEMPAGVKLQFFDSRPEYVYTFLLPPVPAQGELSAQDLMRWAVLCTDITTTITDPA